MDYSIEKQLSRLPGEAQALFANGGVIGLEKESLRVAPDGSISQQPHPTALGAALTHPYITTDYSEALLEMITPPSASSADALAYLSDLQKFVYDNLDDEILWATSMPCVLSGGRNIPLAEYGHSNAGIMKHVYRRGLGHRYGRTMQVIAGVHFNFSFADALWPMLQELRQAQGPLQPFVDASYLALIRNLQRFGWLIPYLFGASPAVCKSFLGDKPTALDEFDANTYYEPFATSLRMGDIGYTNSKEKGVGIKANYNSLQQYIDSLTHAIETSSPLWEEIGLIRDGEYQQLNTNILQIENEYYSTVRPKQILQGFEKPTLALRKRGVRYVELRSLDVNAFHPLGVSQDQLCFLRLFMTYCLLLDSPPINIQERREIDQNIGGVAHRGREAKLALSCFGREIRLSEWASRLCDEMQPIAELFDGCTGGTDYSRVLAEQMEVVRDPDRTPAARMLAEMRANGEGFYHFAKRKSHEHKAYFDSCNLPQQRLAELTKMARQSHQQQAEIEAADEVDFDQFLAHYFAQK